MNIDQSPQSAPANNNTVLSPIAIRYLIQATKWAKFLSILGFIVAALVTLTAIFIGSIFALIARINPMMAMLPATIGSSVTIFYLIIAAIIFVLHLFLFQFASRTQKAFTLQNTDLLDGGIHRLQSFFKMLGIIMITYIVFIVFILIMVTTTISSLPHYN